MRPYQYGLDSISLFNDLKKTNIKTEDFKQILSSYKNLEQKYIKANEVELLKDLVKQQNVLFSYLPSCKKESIKKIATLLNNLENEVGGNLDEISTYETPDRNVKFVKVSYKNGKWLISAHNLEEVEFNKKQTPEAINCLVQVANRLDEQEAAYALCHAKTAGLFVMAELPYVRTEDWTNTALETRFIKDPGTTLGPVEHSWESSVDNTNMPVSRQIASEDGTDTFDTLKEDDNIEDENGEIFTISTKSNDYIITFGNETFTRDEVEENLSSGSWKKIESDQKQDIKVKTILKDINDLSARIYKEKLSMDEAAQRKLAAVSQAIKEAQAADVEKLEKLIAAIEPKIRKMAAKVDSITFDDENGLKKLQVLKENLESGLTLKYSRGVEEYQKRTVPVNKAEEVIEKLRAYVSPKNLKKFDELSEELFQFTSKLETFDISLTHNDPRNEELIQEQLKKLNKNIQTCQNDQFIKNQAYEELDNLIVAGLINFDHYNKLSDFAETNSSMVLDSVKQIKSNLHPIKADLITDVVSKVIELFNNAKDWLLDKLSFLSLQEKQIKDINQDLDQLIQEGE